jgi:site-specific DNA recombinase
VHRLLRNPYYIGYVHYAGADYEGIHEPLIDPATFQRVQSILEAHRLAGERPSRHHHYLRGSLRCGECGSRIGFTNSRGNGGHYAYFYCLGRQKKRTACQQPYVSVETVERSVIDYYASVDFSQHDIEELREIVVERIDQERRLTTKALHRQEQRLAQLDRERRKLLQAHYADALPLDLLKEEQARIEVERSQATRIIEASIVHFDQIEKNLDLALRILKDCQAAYGSASRVARRNLNQSLFEALYVLSGRVIGADLAAPFRQLLAHDLQVSAHVSPKSIERPEGTLPIDHITGVNHRNGSNMNLLAEGVGFEPTRPLSGPSGFQDHRIRPLCHPSWDSKARPSGHKGTCQARVNESRRWPAMSAAGDGVPDRRSRWATPEPACGRQGLRFRRIAGQRSSWPTRGAIEQTSECCGP